MSKESQERIYGQVLGTIRARINAVVKLPDDTQLSLACALNLLFLLKGEWGCVGDYVTTLKALRVTVGNDLTNDSFLGSIQSERIREIDNQSSGCSSRTKCASAGLNCHHAYLWFLAALKALA
jgi:hypothetical protein